MSIEVRNIDKRFGNFHALRNVNLNIASGELVALLGPSGCGKTTLLRIIAGLEAPDSGSIHFAGQDTTGVHVRERGVGFVFQHYALFKHMTVFDNVAFGLRMKPKKERPSEAQIRARVLELLSLVQLDWVAERFPAQLSGGQRQRIALARALAVQPQVLLLDEPFGALDAKVRKELRQWLRQIHHELGITSVLVTHDQEEALELADEIVVMNHGVVEQVGSAAALYQQPQSVFVTEFLGEANAFEHARIEAGRLHVGGYSQAVATQTARQNVAVYVRPHELALSTQPQPNSIGAARIEHIHAVGPQVRVQLSMSGQSKPIQAWLAPAQYRTQPLSHGQTVWLYPQQLTVFRLPEMVEYVI